VIEYINEYEIHPVVGEVPWGVDLLRTSWVAKIIPSIQTENMVTFEISDGMQIVSRGPLVFHRYDRPYADDGTHGIVTQDVVRTASARDGVVCAMCLYTEISDVTRGVARI